MRFRPRPRKIKYFGRFDADIIRNHRITGSATWNDNWTEGVGVVMPVNTINSDIMNANAQLSDYWTISPNTLNEFRWGFMAEYGQTQAPDDGSWAIRKSWA